MAVTAAGITSADRLHLERTVALAWEARNRGDHPFGSLLVTADGRVLEARNSVVTDVDPTGHAETNLVRLAGTLELAARITSTLYTSTEPCAMCAGAIYWSGIGRVVFALSEVALAEMVEEEEGVPPLHLPCREVFARGGRTIVVDGPVDLASATEVHQGFWT
jgi:tRNA(Arg) A34 adenosine deaminase TadA